jgi:hypothetical protein
MTVIGSADAAAAVAVSITAVIAAQTDDFTATPQLCQGRGWHCKQSALPDFLL